MDAEEMREKSVKELIFKCGICLQSYEDIYLYFKHFSKHKQVTFKECFHLCEIDYERGHSLDYCIHCVELTDTKSFACQMCSQSFKTMCMLHKHFVDIHTDISSYTIDIETKEAKPVSNSGSRDFTEISESAPDEVTQVMGDGPFVCCVCNSGHTSVGSFLKHIETHGKFKVNGCFHLCDIEELDEQIQETNRKDTQFSCLTCNSSIQSLCLVFKHFSCKRSSKLFTVSIIYNTVYLGSKQCLNVKRGGEENKIAPKEVLKDYRKDFLEKRTCFVQLEDCADLITASNTVHVDSIPPINKTLQSSERAVQEDATQDRHFQALEDQSVTADSKQNTRKRQGFEIIKQQLEPDSAGHIVKYNTDRKPADGNEESNHEQKLDDLNSSDNEEEISEHRENYTSKLQTKTLLRRPRKNYFKSSFVRKMQYYESKKKLLSQPTICQICGLKLKKMCLRRHMTLVHSDTGPATCDRCGKVFSCRYYCERHIAHIHSNKVYVCDVCGKTFKVKVYLTNHKESHNKERTYKCGDCGKMFFTKEHLRAHRRRKKMVKDQQCPHCNKMFDKHGISNHIRDVHENARKWICTHSGCEKRFNSKRFLRRHLIRHQDVKPEMCDHCGVGFAQRGELKSHVRRIHGVHELPKKKIQDTDRAERMKELVSIDVDPEMFDTDRAERMKKLVSIDVDPEMFGEEGLKTIRI